MRARRRVALRTPPPKLPLRPQPIHAAYAIKWQRCGYARTRKRAIHGCYVIIIYYSIKRGGTDDDCAYYTPAGRAVVATLPPPLAGHGVRRLERRRRAVAVTCVKCKRRRIVRRGIRNERKIKETKKKYKNYNNSGIICRTG